MTFFSTQVMHAPDGFFAVWLSIVGWIVTVLMVAIALRITKNDLDDRQIPLMGLMAAVIFAGQMLNFTIPGGTSGHLLGGALAAIVLGPWAGVLVMSVVVGIQALVFQDGGLLVMGLNIINMGIVTAFTGYFVHQGVTKLIKGKPGILVGGFAAGWLSLVVTAAFTAVQLAVSGTSPLAFAFPVMVGVHAVIGIGEGLLTVAALGVMLAARPDLVTGEDAPGQRGARWVWGGLMLALALTLLAPLASPYSDGMERMAEVFAEPDAVEIEPIFAVPEEPQFFGTAEEAPYTLLPDYTIPLLGDSGVSTIAAGAIGVLIVFGLASGAGWVVRRRLT